LPIYLENEAGKKSIASTAQPPLDAVRGFFTSGNFIIAGDARADAQARRLAAVRQATH